MNESSCSLPYTADYNELWGTREKFVQHDIMCFSCHISHDFLSSMHAMHVDPSSFPMPWCVTVHHHSNIHVIQHAWYNVPFMFTWVMLRHKYTSTHHMLLFPYLYIIKSLLCLKFKIKPFQSFLLKSPSDSLEASQKVARNFSPQLKFNLTTDPATLAPSH